MRNRLTIVTAALVLVSMSTARAAQQQAPPAVAAATTPADTPGTGSIDFGFRGTSATGDAARYERYRDLRSGVASQIVFGKQTDTYLFDARLDNIGYRDQRYSAGYDGGKLSLSGMWDSIPLNYSYLTSTPWVETSPDVFTLDLAARLAVQNKVPGVVGVPQNAAQLATPSIYRGLAQTFDLQSRRDAASVALAYNTSKDAGFDFSFTSTKKSGSQPWGASFAFNVANELPLTLDNRTNDVAAGFEWANQKGMFRAGWNGSWFDNQITELVWDNPFRATDTNPIDASGYSNGNGPARGRMSVAPGNLMSVFSFMGLYKMPAHSTINSTVAFTTMKQDEALIPWTINSVISPLMQALPRTSAEAEVQGVNAIVNFNTRPSRRVGFDARYRFNNHDNKTPHFDATNYVRFDAVPEDTGGLSEQFDIRENKLDLNTTLNLVRYTAIRIGYGYDSYDRTGRSFSSMTDNIFRTSADVLGSQYVTVRALYEHTERRGSGFSEDAIEDGGAQPGLRFYDEANRHSNKTTLLFIANPAEIFNLTVSVGAGDDAYDGPGHEFGLLDNSNRTYNLGIDVTPTSTIAFGANYGRDTYDSNQKARNANPPPDPTFNDPNRDWTLNNNEKVNSVDLYLDLIKAIQRTDIRFSYDYSDSDNGFIFGGPRIPQLAAIGQFIPLANVMNKWNRLTVDVRYFFTTKVGVGLGYWYEKFDVTDFATVDLPGQPGTPRIDYLGEISTGYGNRPYQGNTGFVRLLYSF